MPSPTSGASETINPVKSTYITTSSLQSGKGRTSWAAHSKTCFHAADVAGRWLATGEVVGRGAVQQPPAPRGRHPLKEPTMSRLESRERGWKWQTRRKSWVFHGVALGRGDRLPPLRPPSGGHLGRRLVA